MDPAAIDCGQYLKRIYAWTRLLQMNTSDEALRAQAIERIQQNAETLLRKMSEQGSIRV